MNGIELVNRMDRLAEELFGEFGYDTCSQSEKEYICNQISFGDLNKQIMKELLLEKIAYHSTLSRFNINSRIQLIQLKKELQTLK